MTAYVVLAITAAAGPGGPRLAVTPADVAVYHRDEKQGQSVVKVVAGEELTEWHALAALLVPSVITSRTCWPSGMLARGRRSW